MDIQRLHEYHVAHTTKDMAVKVKIGGETEISRSRPPEVNFVISPTWPFFKQKFFLNKALNTFYALQRHDAGI